MRRFSGLGSVPPPIVSVEASWARREEAIALAVQLLMIIDLMAAGS